MHAGVQTDTASQQFTADLDAEKPNLGSSAAVHCWFVNIFVLLVQKVFSFDLVQGAAASHKAVRCDLKDTKPKGENLSITVALVFV